MSGASIDTDARTASVVGSAAGVAEVTLRLPDGARLAIEHRWCGAGSLHGAPPIVLLHEGLGSVGAWRDFPDRLAAATGRRVLVYSRPGYGASTPRPAAERWAPDFMHRHAGHVLPALLAALGVAGRYALVGHSDGGSIALLHAATHPERVERVVVLAPHLFVEDRSIAGIEAARRAYLETDLRQRLARHHADPDSAFWGWNRIWLDPAFRAWNIETEVARVAAPILAIQGEADEYGTLAQVRTIRTLRPGTRLVELPACGHAPHRERTGEVLDAIGRFFAEPLAEASAEPRLEAPAPSDGGRPTDIRRRPR